MKRFKIALVILPLVLAVSGCGNNKTPANENSAGEGGNNLPTQQTEIKPQSLPDEISAMNEVTSYVGDTDADGTDEKVVLATSAQRSAKGEFMWDDGQKWALYVEEGGGEAYVLVDEYVQTGNVYFDVLDYYLKDGAKPKIMVTVSTGAGYCLKNYTFEKEKSVYTEEVVFDTNDVTEAGINRRFSSIPEIVK